MNPLLKLFVAFCLVSFALSRPFPEGDEEAADGEEDAGGEDAGGEDAGDEGAGEGGEGEGDDAGGDDAGGDDAGGDDAGGDNAGGKGEGKDDRVNTYNKVTEQLDKATKVDNIQSEYLRPALDNELQAGLRNPVIEAIGTIGDYSKISSCFDSMDSDVKKILDQETKSFDDCKSKKDASEYTCSEESSKKAKEEFKQIGSKIVSCVSSKGN